MCEPLAKTRGRVLHYIDTTGPGGGETVFLDVASGMRGRGWQPHAVVVGPGWVLDNVRLRSLPVDIIPTGRRLDLGYALQLRNVVRRERIDLIHAHFFSPSVYAAAVSITTGVPVVATFHGAPDIVHGGRLIRARYRLISGRSTIVCVSRAVRQELLRSNAVAPNRAVVIYNGIPIDSFSGRNRSLVRRELGVPDDAILVGALGNVRPAKDYETFLRAASALSPDKRFHFAVAGDTSHALYPQLMALRDGLGLTSRFHFLGFREDAPDILAAFDVLMISSKDEGFSLATVQAMAAGTPVVATRCGGPEEIISHGFNGILVSTGSPDELAQAVRQVVNDRELRESMVARAKDTAAGNFSTKAMLDGYDALYGHLVRRNLLGRQRPTSRS